VMGCSIQWGGLHEVLWSMWNTVGKRCLYSEKEKDAGCLQRTCSKDTILLFSLCLVFKNFFFYPAGRSIRSIARSCFEWLWLTIIRLVFSQILHFLSLPHWPIFYSYISKPSLLWKNSIPFPSTQLNFIFPYPYLTTQRQTQFF
jgi:hypothetical protein